jgi:UDPglucose 6-dehydrogenase
MRVTVIGAGHVGLVTAVTIAQLGHEVIASDNDPEKIAQLLGGRARQLRAPEVHLGWSGSEC